MLNIVKKIISFVFMKKNTPTCLYSSCTDQKSATSVPKDDCIFGDNNSYDDINPCDDPEIFADHDNFVRVRAFNPPNAIINHISESDTYTCRGDSLTNCDMVDKGEKYREPKNISFLGSSVRYMSNYALHYLHNSHYLAPFMPKVLNKANPNKDTEKSEAFDLVESREEVAKKQEDEEIDEIIRKHSLRYPMEAVIVENLRSCPGILKEFIHM